MGRDCDSSNGKFLAPFPEIYVSYNTLLVEDHGPFVTSYLEKKGAEGKNTFLLLNFITMLSFLCVMWYPRVAEFDPLFLPQGVTFEHHFGLLLMSIVQMSVGGRGYKRPCNMRFCTWTETIMPYEAKMIFCVHSYFNKKTNVYTKIITTTNMSID